MKEYTKDAIIRGAVVASIGLLIFFAVIVAIKCFNGGWWALPVPYAFAAYGAYKLVMRFKKHFTDQDK